MRGRERREAKQRESQKEGQAQPERRVSLRCSLRPAHGALPPSWAPTWPAKCRVAPRPHRSLTSPELLLPLAWHQPTPAASHPIRPRSAPALIRTARHRPPGAPPTAARARVASGREPSMPWALTTEHLFSLPFPSLPFPSSPLLPSSLPLALPSSPLTPSIPAMTQKGKKRTEIEGRRSPRRDPQSLHLKRASSQGQTHAQTHKKP